MNYSGYDTLFYKNLFSIVNLLSRASISYIFPRDQLPGSENLSSNNFNPDFHFVF